MRYILMMHAPHGDGEYEILTSWTPEDLKAHLDYWHELNRALVDSGEMVSVEALTPPGQAKVVRARTDGVPAVTDGPFPETKEFLAGYWIVDVERPERAYEIAATASAAPGPGGALLLMPIEVRQVMRSPIAEM
ncbi:MAG TPA: YciI family protein [Agromyces sp.]|nr:YciI family protein [Agromyces sp.]